MVNENLECNEIDSSIESRPAEMFARQAVAESDSVCAMVVLLDANGRGSYSLHGGNEQLQLHLLSQLDQIRAQVIPQLQKGLQ